MTLTSTAFDTFHAETVITNFLFTIRILHRLFRSVSFRTFEKLIDLLEPFSLFACNSLNFLDKSSSNIIVTLRASNHIIIELYLRKHSFSFCKVI